MTITKLVLIQMLLAGMAVAGIAVPAYAQADVSAACWAHLGSVTTSNSSPAADRRYHLEHGEPSPCTEYDAAESSQRQEKPREEKHEDKKNCHDRCNKWWRND